MHEIHDVIIYTGSDGDDDELYEIWDEDDQAFQLGTLNQEDEEPRSEPQMQMVQKESLALSTWLIRFVMCMQAVFHLSDTVLSFFLGFFRAYMSVLGRFSKMCADIAQCLPSSLYKARLLENKLIFDKYVVCKQCHNVYPFSDCVEGPRNARRSKACPFQHFPSHPQQRMRKPCGSVLLKTVELASGKTYLYPRLTYCYLGLEVSLQAFLNRPGFFSACDDWRSRQVSTGTLVDIFDGKIWKDFQFVDHKPFLSQPGNLALMLNMDFFQPMKHVQYSLGAIYMTILNLPRGLRNKEENVILVGLIPGPREPEHDINSFLEPLVNDLLKLWKGVNLDVHSYTSKKEIRCALVCVACDLPAGRKVCGFLHHSARLGCSRCWKEFPGSVGTMDYSGFDRENWQLRSGSEHTRIASKLRKFNTKSDMEKSESKSGCRYSILLKLPYFDPPRMLVVDPMHNLFLGSAKHFVKSILLGKDVISQSDYDIVQQRVDSTVAPCDIGRIPNKIHSGFSSFTADQWKNWVTYFSLFALRGLLPDDMLECWRHFVLACRVLCHKQITLQQVCLGDALLMQFCRRTERIFGKEVVTPNMHMHCHLRECILDYGPLHSFWLYAFERYNGILGDMPNNNHSIEIQIMKRFLSENQMVCSTLPDEFCNEFQSLFPRINQTGSVSDTLSIERPVLTDTTKWSMDLDHFKLPKHSSRQVIYSTRKDHLMELYSELHSVSRSALTISNTYLRYTCAFVDGKILGSHKTRMSSSSIVMVDWDKTLFGPCLSSGTEATVPRAAKIDFFCKHDILCDGRTISHLLVSLSWFKYHPENTKFGKPTSVWFHDIFEPDGIHTLIPIQFVKSRTISLIEKLDGQSVLFVCPCVDF